jgi:hypothetical protein
MNTKARKPSAGCRWGLSLYQQLKNGKDYMTLNPKNW